LFSIRPFSNFDESSLINKFELAEIEAKKGSKSCKNCDKKINLNGE